MEYKDNLTAEYVRSILNYDPETGIFVWKDREELTPNNRAKLTGKVAGTKGRYIRLCIDRQYYLAHRIAWIYIKGNVENFKKMEVDHINLDKHDNRINNLRICNNKANNRHNRKKLKTNTTGYKGVFKDKNKFRSSISVNNKRIYLGYFDTAEEAYEAYCNAAGEFHGEFARF